VLNVDTASSTTNNLIHSLDVESHTTGTAANGVGTGIKFWGSMTGQNRIELGQIGFHNQDVSGANGDFVVLTRPNATSVERFRIDSSGRVTMPSQPAFQAYQTSGQGNLPYQTWHSVDFGTERFDQGSNYSGAGFTAPVTGKYLLSANVEVDQNASGSFIFLRMRTSNQSYYNMNGQAATDYQSNSITVLADMDANDTAYVDVYMSTGSTADITAGLYTYWSGYLVA
jgi:hypothetical protein